MSKQNPVSCTNTFTSVQSSHEVTVGTCCLDPDDKVASLCPCLKFMFGLTPLTSRSSLEWCLGGCFNAALEGKWASLRTLSLLLEFDLDLVGTAGKLWLRLRVVMRTGWRRFDWLRPVHAFHLHFFLFVCFCFACWKVSSQMRLNCVVTNRKCKQLLPCLFIFIVYFTSAVR